MCFIWLKLNETQASIIGSACIDHWANRLPLTFFRDFSVAMLAFPLATYLALIE